MPSQTLVDRVRHAGITGASTIDLLAIAFSRRETDVPMADGMAREMLKRLGRVQNLAEIDIDLIRELSGLEGFDALRCQALIELGRRAGGAGKGDQIEISRAAEVAALFDHLRNEKKEHFCAVLLDAKNVVIATRQIHVGTLGMSIVGPREVFREAIREGASSLVVVHNHPSGDPTPSPEDIDITDKLVGLGKALDIPVVDHIIIGERRYFSFKEKGVIE